MTQSASTSHQQVDSLAAYRVLDMLDNWSERMSGHQTQKRGAVRQCFRQQLTLFFTDNEQSVGEARDNSIIEVWSRNISKSGIVFITQELIKPKKVVICLQGKAGEPIYLHAEIVRSRQVHDHFWEYGAQFKERAHM